MTIIIIVVVVVLLVGYGVSTYNKLIRLRNKSEESAAAIDAHLKKRYDLIPNIVETVKGYAQHEKKTLTAVIEARNAAMGATTLSEKDEASQAFSSTLKSLFALSESYPELKANQGFLDLQQQLQRIEEELLQVRKYYNAVVKEMNTMVETIPSSFIAKIASFTKSPYLTVEEQERERVDVKF
ncbi:MAG: LemA family protein [Sphaerochaetaceae bacterium]|jgi:LemA protein